MIDDDDVDVPPFPSNFSAVEFPRALSSPPPSSMRGGSPRESESEESPPFRGSARWPPASPAFWTGSPTPTPMPMPTPTPTPTLTPTPATPMRAIYGQWGERPGFQARGDREEDPWSNPPPVSTFESRPWSPSRTSVPLGSWPSPPVFAGSWTPSHPPFPPSDPCRPATAPLPGPSAAFPSPEHRGAHYGFRPGRECKFCKNNGETQELYRSHVLRNPSSGQLICPVLREHVCEVCGATGDGAHTRNYCPAVKAEKKMKYALPLHLKRTKRQSDGQVR